VGLFASLFRPSSTRPTAPEPVLALDGVIDEDDVARLSVEIRLDAKGEIPAVVPLLSPDAKGMVRTLKGDLLFDEAAQKSVLAKAADWGNDYCFDYGHAMLSPAPGSRPADNEEAAGWYRLAIDGTNLVTQGLSWIPDAADRLKARKIRYVSPAVRFDQKTRRVTEFINAALTNLPATKGMRPLVASRTNEPAPQETSMLKSLLSLLGLSSAATEDDALAQIASLAAFKKELVALSGKASAEEILSEARGWKTASAEVQELKKEVFALSGKTTPAEVLEDVKRWKDHSSAHAKLLGKQEEKKAKKAKKKLKKMVAKAIDNGQLPPSLKEKALELGRKSGVEFLEEFLSTFKKIEREPDTEKPGEKGDGKELSKEEKEVCAQLGLKEDAFKAIKASGSVSVSDFVAKDDGEGADKNDKKGDGKDDKGNGVAHTYAAGTNGPKVKTTTAKDA